MKTITHEDIDFLVEDIPLPPTPFKDIAKFNRDKIVKYIHDVYLGKKISDKTKKIVKTKWVKGVLEEEIMEINALTALKDSITEMYHRSLMSAGEPVGIRAAMAIAQPLMQMNFNTFHNVGAANEGGGVKDIQELLNISSKVRKAKGKVKTTTDYTTIHFKDKFLTREEMTMETISLVQKTIADLVENHEYLEDILPGDKKWYDINEEIFQRKRPNFPFLRLYINLNRMFEASITMENIKNVLEVEGNKVVVFYSPMSVGILDIYPDGSDLREMVEGYEKSGRGLNQCQTSRSTKYKEKQELTEKEDIRYLFLQIVYDCLSQIVVMGNRGVEGVAVVTNFLTTFMTFEKYESPNHYKVVVDSEKIKLGNFPFDNFVKFMEEVSLKDKKKFGVVETSSKLDESFFIIVKSEDDPKKYIMELLKAEKIKVSGEAEYNLEHKILKLPEYSKLYRCAYYSHARVSGSKICGSLMKHPSLDRMRVIPNNVIDIARLFGIEAARTYLVQFYLKIITGNGGSVKTCENIGLLADFQTLSGMLTSVNANGAAKRQSSALTNAAFQDPYGAFQKSAAFGKTEEVLGVSECIMTGKKLNIGCGFVQVNVPAPEGKIRKSPKIPMIKEEVAGDEYIKKFDDYPRQFSQNLGAISDGHHYEVISRKPSRKILDLFVKSIKKGIIDDTDSSSDDEEFQLPQFKNLNLDDEE